MCQINILAGLVIILSGLIFGPFIIGAMCAVFKDLKKVITGK